MSTDNQLLSYVKGNIDVTFMHSIIEEYVQVSGFPVDVYLLSNRTIDQQPKGTTGDAYHVAQEVTNSLAADSILGEMRKRNYDTAVSMWCLPDQLERENYLEKFGLVNQNTMNLHFAIHSLEATLSRHIMPGDLIVVPSETESRIYEATDTMRSDYELYNSYMLKVSCVLATTDQALAPIPSTDIPYDTELLTNTSVENDARTQANQSGISYLEEID